MKLSKNNDSIKAGNVYFMKIEIIHKSKNKISKKNYFVKDFLRICKKKKKLNSLYNKLQTSNKVIKNRIFNKRKILIFGILNLTPDSFSDGGEHFDINKSLEQALYMFENGANFIDVGGESTRPGADKVDESSEILRVMPTIQKLNNLNIPISLDTRNASTMEFGIISGVKVINDVSGLENDPKSIEIIKKYKKDVIIMHMPGTPKTMMKKNKYSNVVLDVYDFLENKIKICENNNIKRSRIIIDPGIGFGKDLEQNLDILRNLSIFHTLECPIMIGLSRKRFISSISKADEPKKRLGGTISASLIALQQGVNIHRVHDVAEINQSIKVFEKIVNQ